MNIIDLMKEQNINLDWLFVMTKLNDKEGLMYFEPVLEAIDGVDVTNLVPQCFIIDGAKFVYDDSMDSNIVIHSSDDVVIFTRVDGIQLNIDTKKIKGFPFKCESFGTKLQDINVVDHKHNVLIN